MQANRAAEQQIQQELDDVSTSVGALCELLAAAQQSQVSAASIHTLLQPISRRLDVAAGTLADNAAAVR